MRPLACKRKGSVPTRTREKDTGAERWDHEEVKSEVVERNWTITGYYCHCSVTKSCSTLCDPINCSTPGFPVPHHLLEFAQVHVHHIGDAAQLTHPLSSPSPPAFNLSQHQSLFQWVAVCIKWPKYWSFSISPSNEYSELISFWIDWFDLLAVQGTLKSLL